MNHYPHHIGDFDKATRHLTRIERSIYRDLIELYYDTEQPLTLDRAALCRKIIARTNEEATAVEQTLNEFFTETATGWYHDRCEEEIERYRANNSQKAEAGKASAAARELKRQQALNGNSTDVERTLNGTPTNQEPEPEPLNTPAENPAAAIKKPKSSKPKTYPIPTDFGISKSVQTWADEKGHTRLAERLEHFVGWAKSSGKVYADWDQTFMNAIRGDWAKLGTAVIDEENWDAATKLKAFTWKASGFPMSEFRP